MWPNDPIPDLSATVDLRHVVVTPLRDRTPNRPLMIELIAAYGEIMAAFGGDDPANGALSQHLERERQARTALLAEYDRVTGYDPTAPTPRSA